MRPAGSDLAVHARTDHRFVPRRRRGSPFREPTVARIRTHDSRERIGHDRRLRLEAPIAPGRFGRAAPSTAREHARASGSELDAYKRRIDDSARRRPDLDVNLAEAILRTCRTLLGDWTDLSEEERRLVQLACDYYVDPYDEDGDLESVFGFDDDAEVVNLVLNELGREDLQVRI
jgi:uncharacterized membrane protein YkvA (DUF1232 family)